MQCEEAAHHGAAPVKVGRSRGVFERARRGRYGFRPGQQALGGALDLEEAGAAIAVTLVNSRRQVRDLVGQPRRTRVNFGADFEQAERVPVLAVCR